jgi:hypothetical protein
MRKLVVVACFLTLASLGVSEVAAQGLTVSIISPGSRWHAGHHVPPRRLAPHSSRTGIVVFLPVAIGFPNIPCIEVHVMSTLARISDEGPSLSGDLSVGATFVCENLNARFERWPGSGARALALGNRWYYPNGQQASVATGAWYYPDGTVARTSTGIWSYPNGEVARRRDGTWYAPDGARVGKLDHPQDALVIVGMIEQMWFNFGADAS